MRYHNVTNRRGEYRGQNKLQAPRRAVRFVRHGQCGLPAAGRSVCGAGDGIKKLIVFTLSELSQQQFDITDPLKCYALIFICGTSEIVPTKKYQIRGI